VRLECQIFLILPVIHKGLLSTAESSISLSSSLRGKSLNFQDVNRPKSDQTGGYTGLSGRPIQTKGAAGSDQMGETAGE
jgi:hypothetical protein